MKYSVTAATFDCAENIITHNSLEHLSNLKKGSKRGAAFSGPHLPFPRCSEAATFSGGTSARRDECTP